MSGRSGSPAESCSCLEMVLVKIPSSGCSDNVVSKEEFCWGVRKRTGDTTNAINDIVDHLLANGVVTTGIVVGSILLAADEQLRVEERAVATSADLVDGRRVQVDEDGAGHVLAAAGLGEEGLIRATLDGFLDIGVGTTIGAEAVLEEVPKSRTLSAWKSSLNSMPSP